MAHSLRNSEKKETKQMLESINPPSSKPAETKIIKMKQGIWRTYDATDGLPGQPNCLLQDSYGYLWIGTDAGLCRYDGLEFITYTTKDGLNSYYVSSLCLDNQEKLWIGTGNGLSCFDGKQFTNNGLVNTWITSLCLDSRERLWIGTDNGLSCLDKNGFTNYTTDNGLPHNIIHSICEDKKKGLWIGTENGLSCFDGKHFTNYTTADGVPHNQAYPICMDNQGRLWISLWYSGKGVSCFDGENFRTYTSDDRLVGPQNFCLTIYNDHLGRIWFGGWDGVSCYDGEQFINYNYTMDDNVSAVHAILEDREGQMWFAHGELSYLSCYDEKTIQLLTDQPNTWVADQDKKGRIWFNNGSGIYAIRLDSKSSEVEQRKILFDGGLIGLMVDSSDHLWISPFYYGLYRYDSTDIAWESAGGEAINNPHHFIISNNMFLNNAVPLLENKDGTIWFGIGASGLSRFDPELFMEGEPIESINRGSYCLIEDSKGRFWLGNQRSQLLLWDGDEFTSYGQENGFTNNGVMSLFKDGDKIWLGTTRGLWCHDNERFIHYGEEYGLIDLYHWRHIAKDRFNQLWFATHGGVYRTDGKHFQWLTKDDGLPSNYVVRILPQPDGSMIICTNRGIARYRMTATLPPRVEIREVIADKVYQNPDEIELTTTSANLLTISYHGLSLATRRMRYSYILEGYDKEWRETWERQILYENLPIGEYTFKIIAINRDLVASESPAEMKLKIVQDPRDIKVNELESSLIIKSQQLAFLQRKAEREYQFDNIIGKSEAIEWVKNMMITAIESGLNVLITGETGTGKEQIATGIHYNSPRKDKPCIPYNCGTAQKEFIKSDLFGHRKGAFTGAIENKMGLFETAQGGTVLLDEIGDTPLDAQTYLLDVLEKHKVQRMGEYILRDVDVRVISMTNRDLSNEMKEGHFREDLYFRLDRFNIYIPPLRQRRDDIPLLAEHFYNKACKDQHKELDGFATGVIDMLVGYQWPGNVRELENEINRACALAQAGSAIQSYHFTPNITHGESLAQEIISKRMDYNESLKQFRRRLIEKTLQECDGNRTKAANMLGIDRTNLVHLIKSLGIK